MCNDKPVDPAVMPSCTFGERERFTDYAPDSLAQGVVPSLHGRGLAGLLALALVMCQQYSGHTVKLTYIVFRKPLVKSSYWQNVSVPDYKKLRYIRIYRALLLPGSDSTDGESARFSRYEKTF
jgi:hypothetical protein